MESQVGSLVPQWLSVGLLICLSIERLIKYAIKYGCSAISAKDNCGLRCDSCCGLFKGQSILTTNSERDEAIGDNDNTKGNYETVKSAQQPEPVTATKENLLSTSN